MNSNSRQDARRALDLAHEPDFALGAATVRPSACEVRVAGSVRRLEPRVMQVLVALVQAQGAVVSRDELMARCWTGLSVSEDAITRAVGQLRRVAPATVTVETIPKVGYRLIKQAAPARSHTPFPGVAPFVATILLALSVVLFVVMLRDSPPAEAEAAAALGTGNADANDRYLRAAALLDSGGRDNALRAEQLLREALALDPDFHAATETLAVALLSVATFVPERAGEAQAESALLAGNEIEETPLVWRAQAIRGFRFASQGQWLAAEQALTDVRRNAPEAEQSVGNGLQIFLHGSVGRYRDSLDLVKEQAQSQPVSRAVSRMLQQWLNRSGEYAAAKAEYERSRDLPGDRSSMEMAALVRALGGGDANTIEQSFANYRETDWGRAGDEALYAVRSDSEAALAILSSQIESYTNPDAMPPFLAAAWAVHYGDLELAVQGLRAAPASLFQTAGMIWDPVFATVRRTSAFRGMLHDFGYVEYWRVTGNWGDFCRPLGDDDFECI